MCSACYYAFAKWITNNGDPARHIFRFHSQKNVAPKTGFHYSSCAIQTSTVKQPTGTGAGTWAVLKPSKVRTLTSFRIPGVMGFLPDEQGRRHRLLSGGEWALSRRWRGRGEARPELLHVSEGVTEAANQNREHWCTPIMAWKVKNYRWSPKLFGGTSPIPLLSTPMWMMHFISTKQKMSSQFSTRCNFGCLLQMFVKYAPVFLVTADRNDCSAILNQPH